jgi:hypothetical protein
MILDQGEILHVEWLRHTSGLQFFFSVSLGIAITFADFHTPTHEGGV